LLGFDASGSTTPTYFKPSTTQALTPVAGRRCGTRSRAFDADLKKDHYIE
jgi:hypothetical protein